MRNKLLLLLSIILIYSCSLLHQSRYRQNRIKNNSWMNGKSFMLNNNRGGAGFKNKDLSQNIYKVDTIRLEKNRYTIIMSNKTNHSFVVTKEFWNSDRFSEKKILESPSCFILGYRMNNLVSSYYYLPWNNPLVDKNIYDMDLEGDTDLQGRDFLLYQDSVSLVKETYRSFHYGTPPSYYYLILIRGDVFNQMCHSWMDGITYSWLDFPNLSGYYKVLVPLWEMNHGKRKHVKKKKY